MGKTASRVIRYISPDDLARKRLGYDWYRGGENDKNDPNSRVRELTPARPPDNI